MFSQNVLIVFLFLNILQSFDFQSVVLDRNLLQQLLGSNINNRALNLNQKKIKDISPNTFAGLTNCEELYLSNNELKSIESYTFKDLTNLQMLVLEFNSIGSIAPDAFSGLTNLRDLYFHKNQVNASYVIYLLLNYYIKKF